MRIVFVVVDMVTAPQGEYHVANLHKNGRSVNCHRCTGKGLPNGCQTSRDEKTCSRFSDVCVCV